MCFVGGAYTNISGPDMRINFLRQLFSTQLDRSGELSAFPVEAFNMQLKVPVAQHKDALYLHKKSLYTGKPGVFSRNLLMCRQVNAVLVYGEALYQDNRKEAELLMNWKEEANGKRSNQRLSQVAKAYVAGLSRFLEARP